MVQLLTGLAALVLVASGAVAAGLEDRHELDWKIDLTHASLSTALGAWTDGGSGKFRFDEDDAIAEQRLVADYRVRLSPTIRIISAVEYSEGLGTNIGLTEAYVDWRPVPRSANEVRVRAGAFYPPFSLENGGPAWSSPFTTSYSAINSWLGEEVRPLGLEFRLNRSLGYAGSPHTIGLFASGFYGNDPAGTLLFWRGFALHDRQTRLNERIALPSMTLRDANGGVIGQLDRRLDPIDEIDGEPGFYGGVEWRLRRRAVVQLARYDNRADPESFSGGQWGWDTRFWHLAAQVQLPGDLGLVTQWMRGSTAWLTFTTTGGLRTARTELVDDEFESRYLLLTKRIGERHRISVRYDWFDFMRPDGLNIDAGDAVTIGYRFSASSRLTLAAEWLRIDSTRDPWPLFYAASQRQSERQFLLQLSVALFRNER